MNKYLISPVIIGLLFSSVSMAENTLTTEKEKLSYGLGILLSERVLKKFTDIDYQQLLEGIKAQHQGKPTLMSMTEANQLLANQRKMEAEKKFGEVISKGKNYLAENAKKEGVSVTSSGLQYSVKKAGTGNKPKATDKVTVHYRGTLLDGSEFDSSYSRGKPATFGLNQVISGWTEGVQLMSVGAQYQFVIPSEMAYGARGSSGKIGPHEVLIFDIELISIN